MNDTKTPVKLRGRDMITVEDLFIREGYVLRFPGGQTAFSDRTFAEFFRDELNINIDDPKWTIEGSSKGKRLRYFLRNTDQTTAMKTLRSLWDYRETFRQRHRIPEDVENARTRLDDVLNHLGGSAQNESASPAAKDEFKHVKYDVIYQALMSLTGMSPQERGYQFEKFLKKVFDAFSLQAERPFRLTGEQIDGSFVLDGETYLIEAKWQNEPIGAGELHAFHGKLDQRAAWARGVFISYSGFSEQGLIAFGRARKVICVDGLDLSEAFRRRLPLPEVFRRKVRRAVEHGVTLARLSDIFPQDRA